jgi:hypothetical protein
LRVFRVFAVCCSWIIEISIEDRQGQSAWWRLFRGLLGGPGWQGRKWRRLKEMISVRGWIHLLGAPVKDADAESFTHSGQIAGPIMVKTIN